MKRFNQTGLCDPRSHWSAYVESKDWSAGEVEKASAPNRIARVCSCETDSFLTSTLIWILVYSSIIHIAETVLQ